MTSCADPGPGGVVVAAEVARSLGAPLDDIAELVAQAAYHIAEIARMGGNAMAREVLGRSADGSSARARVRRHE